MVFGFKIFHNEKLYLRKKYQPLLKKDCSDTQTKVLQKYIDGQCTNIRVRKRLFHYYSILNNQKS